MGRPAVIPNTTPVVPDPGQVRMLVEEAKKSRGPEYARALFITATTGDAGLSFALSAAAVTSTGTAA